MSVPSGFLALLTLGPAYGSQLQKEFLARAPHREQLNAGQVYATLERLSRRGLVAREGETSDGLPLYRLTPSGSDAAREWLSTPAGDPGDWFEMQDQVLIAASLDTRTASALIVAIRDRLEPRRAPDAQLPDLGASTLGDAAGRSRPAEAARAAERAQVLLVCAALSWIDEVRAELRQNPDAFLRARKLERPRRGRRHRDPGGAA